MRVSYRNREARTLSLMGVTFVLCPFNRLITELLMTQQPSQENLIILQSVLMGWGAAVTHWETCDLRRPYLSHYFFLFFFVPHLNNDIWAVDCNVCIFLCGSIELDGFKLRLNATKPVLGVSCLCASVLCVCVCVCVCLVFWACLQKNQSQVLSWCLLRALLLDYYVGTSRTFFGL